MDKYDKSLTDDVLNLFNNQKKFNICLHEEQVWFSKIFTPEFNFSIKENSIQSKYSKTENGKFVLLSTKSSDITYNLSYNVLGATVTESFVIRHYVDGPSEMYGQGSFIAQISIVSEKTSCKTVPAFNSNNTNFKVGVFDVTRIDTYTSPGDYLQDVSWSGHYQKKGAINFEVGWSYTMPLTGISFTVTYQNSEKYQDGNLKSFDNSGSTKVRQGGIILDKGKELTDVGDFFLAKFTINKYSNPGNKVF